MHIMEAEQDSVKISVSRCVKLRDEFEFAPTNDNKHINLNDKEEQQLWITKNW